MATGSLVAFNHTTKLIGEGKINFSSHDLRVVACSTPPSAANTLKTQLSAAANLSAATIALTSETWTTVTTNDAKFDAANLTFTATGASTIKALAIYNESATSPLDALVAWGYPNTAAVATGVVLAGGEKLQVVWHASNGIARLIFT